MVKKWRKNKKCSVFATILRPGRLRDGSPGKKFDFFRVFWPKKSRQGSLFGPPQIPKWLQNRTFEARSALGPSKNGLGEGFWKKSKNGWKNDWKKDQKSCKNWSKIHWKIDTFSNLRFLVFCKESYVKMRILQVGGIENLIKMMKKTMPKWGCQKVEKSMPKGSPKVMFFGPKSTLGAPRVDLFSIFIDFLTPQTDFEKSTFFRTIKNQAKWPNKAPLERQGVVFWAKSITFGLPFGIDFSTFSENGESVL